LIPAYPECPSMAQFVPLHSGNNELAIRRPTQSKRVTRDRQRWVENPIEADKKPDNRQGLILSDIFILECEKHSSEDVRARHTRTGAIFARCFTIRR
jgi:hypothetical protein